MPTTAVVAGLQVLLLEAVMIVSLLEALRSEVVEVPVSVERAAG